MSGFLNALAVNKPKTTGAEAPKPKLNLNLSPKKEEAEKPKLNLTPKAKPSLSLPKKKEEPVAVVEETVEAVAPVEEPVVVEPVAVVEEVVEQETVVEEVAETVTEEPAPEPAVEEEKPAEKPKRKSSSRKKKETATVTEVTPVMAPQSQELTKDLYEAMINSFVPFLDEEFEAQKEDIIDRLNQIEITSDMNPALLADAISEISRLRDEIWIDFTESRALFDNLANEKPGGLIEQIKRLYGDNGSNDAARKRAATEACLSYKIEGQEATTNLFQVLYEARRRYYFFKGAMDQIEFKRQLLISTVAALKVESSLQQ